jgi:photosystem II stability/assembly factor-like uncharacterized protein
MLSPNEGWAVGGNGTILRWDGSSWSVVPIPTSRYFDFYSIYMISENDGWAGGRSGIFHWDGFKWTEISFPFETVLSIHMVAPDDGWAAGVFIGE